MFTFTFQGKHSQLSKLNRCPDEVYGFQQRFQGNLRQVSQIQSFEMYRDAGKKGAFPWEEKIVSPDPFMVHFSKFKLLTLFPSSPLTLTPQTQYLYEMFEFLTKLKLMNECKNIHTLLYNVWHIIWNQYCLLLWMNAFVQK